MISFRVSFTVDDDSRDEFVRMVEATYGPALARQPGYHGHRLMAPYTSGPAAGAPVPGTVRLELEFEFDSEEARQAWAASADHAPAWEAAMRLSRSQASFGFHVLLPSGTRADDAAQADSETLAIDSAGGRQ